MADYKNYPYKYLKKEDMDFLNDRGFSYEEMPLIDRVVDEMEFGMISFVMADPDGISLEKPRQILGTYQISKSRAMAYLGRKHFFLKIAKRVIDKDRKAVSVRTAEQILIAPKGSYEFFDDLKKDKTK